MQLIAIHPFENRTCVYKKTEWTKTALPVEIFKQILIFVRSQPVERVNRYWHQISTEIALEDFLKLKKLACFLGENLEEALRDEKVKCFEMGTSDLALDLGKEFKVKRSVLKIKETIIEILMRLQHHELIKLKETSSCLAEDAFIEGIFDAAAMYKILKGPELSLIDKIEL